MGKCNNCKKEILYNQYKEYRGKILCKECYATRLVRKRQKKAKAEEALLTEKETNKKAEEFGMITTDEPLKDLPQAPEEKTEEPDNENSKND